MRYQVLPKTSTVGTVYSKRRRTLKCFGCLILTSGMTKKDNGKVNPQPAKNVHVGKSVGRIIRCEKFMAGQARPGAGKRDWVLYTQDAGI